MFFNIENRAVRLAATGIDMVIDFATLGEYRVVLDHGAVLGSAIDGSAVDGSSLDRGALGRPAEDAVRPELWADGIEWSTPDRTRVNCSMPRARDRDRARARIRD